MKNMNLCYWSGKLNISLIVCKSSCFKGVNGLIKVIYGHVGYLK